MKRPIVTMLLLSFSMLYAHNPKYQQQAVSKPISIIQDHGFYVGLGAGYFDLQNSTVDEKLSSGTASAIAGYDPNRYVSIEARYTQGITHLRYQGTTSKTLNSTYSNLAAYAKVGYPIAHLKPYVLIGYGMHTITDLAGKDRYESSVQYGAGVAYRATPNVSVFADYIIAYDGTGFDGRATQDSLRANVITIGATYHF